MWFDEIASSFSGEENKDLCGPGGESLITLMVVEGSMWSRWGITTYINGCSLVIYLRLIMK